MSGGGASGKPPPTAPGPIQSGGASWTRGVLTGPGAGKSGHQRPSGSKSNTRPVGPGLPPCEPGALPGPPLGRPAGEPLPAELPPVEPPPGVPPSGEPLPGVGPMGPEALFDGLPLPGSSLGEVRVSQPLPSCLRTRRDEAPSLRQSSSPSSQLGESCQS